MTPQPLWKSSSIKIRRVLRPFRLAHFYLIPIVDLGLLIEPTRNSQGSDRSFHGSISRASITSFEKNISTEPGNITCHAFIAVDCTPAHPGFRASPVVFPIERETFGLGDGVPQPFQPCVAFGFAPVGSVRTRMSKSSEKRSRRFHPFERLVPPFRMNSPVWFAASTC